MQAVAEKVIARAKELLASGEVQRVLGWEKGEFDYERTPALFEQGNIDKLVYEDVYKRQPFPRCSTASMASTTSA